MKYVDRARPVNGLDGKFSLQYTVAAALLDGAVTIDTFSNERRFRADMETMLGRVTLEQDAAIPGDFHAMHVDVEVRLANGERLAAVCRGPKGSWGVPLPDRDHRMKLDDCLKRALPPENVERLLRLLDALDELDAAGVREVVQIIAAEKQD